MSGGIHVKNMIYEQFYKCYKILKTLSRHYLINTESNEKGIAALITEQLTLTKNILTLLGHESVAKKRTCHAISMLYRSNETFNTAFVEWLNNFESKSLMTSQMLHRRRFLTVHLRGHLIAAVPFIDTYFGKLNTRQIIPGIFRYEATFR